MIEFSIFLAIVIIAAGSFINTLGWDAFKAHVKSFFNHEA